MNTKHTPGPLGASEIERGKIDKEFGIREQPVPTCPMIDDVIADIRRCERELKNHSASANADELSVVIDDVNYYIARMEGKMDLIINELLANLSQCFAFRSLSMVASARLIVEPCE